ncbi:low-affinity phosphate transporter [Microbotryomycetes sp. JL221]|nr:low-affinity phosphate transporter [Microbotryomycetes sp. JL221]
MSSNEQIVWSITRNNESLHNSNDPSDHDDVNGIELVQQPAHLQQQRRIVVDLINNHHHHHHPRRQHKMKFSHSLLFNAAPAWQGNYLNYDALKAAIYRFEKQALEPQPTQYRDHVDHDDDIERQQLLANSQSTATIPNQQQQNEKLFRKLLDKELDKITEFYVDKERELLSDVCLLQADMERLEEEASGLSALQGGAVTSGPSSDEDEPTQDNNNNNNKTSNAISSIINNPRRYNDASNNKRRNSKFKRSRSTSIGNRQQTRNRTLSNASATSDLLDLQEEDEQQQQSSNEPRLRRAQSSTSKTSGSRRRSNSRSNALFRNAVSGDDDDDDDLAEAGWTGSSDWAIDTRIMLKRRISALFTSLTELKQYVELNHTGLSKILKKYDKITNSSLRSEYMKQVVDKTFPFEQVTQQRLQSAIQTLIPLYANVASNGDEEFALKQLNAQLREHIVWERNTVWREMIGLERRGWGGASSALTGGKATTSTDIPIVVNSNNTSSDKTELVTPVGKLTLPSWLTGHVIAGVIALLVFGILLNVNWFDRVEEQNCLALLVFVTILWALEIIPLFVTALLVPFLVVVLRVLRSTDGQDRRLSAAESTKYIFGQMFSPTIMLLLGGFTLASGLSKQNIDKVLATKVLSFAGTKPRNVLLAYMGVACFASMWISNVAAPVLCYSLIQPILRTLPSKSPFSKSLILGIALASNIGGMASPISSPQNLIALEYMNPPISWLNWFAVSIPVASTSILIIWLMLLWSYKTNSKVSINPVRLNRDKWTKTQWFVSIVSLLTILLWCIEARLAWLLGDMGIIAILPIVLFYGTGILRKADFDHSPWSIVFLAMGGIALGKAVLSSGLLDDMDHVIQNLVLGLDIWPILAIFSIVVLIIATLISHTIASVLVVPIAAQIGSAMQVPHPRLLIFSTALICSAGMGLPISGFPNLQAINVEDDMGQRYLEPKDFFLNGIPSSIFAVVVVITIGFGIMRILGL